MGVARANTGERTAIDGAEEGTDGVKARLDATPSEERRGEARRGAERFPAVWDVVGGKGAMTSQAGGRVLGWRHSSESER